MHCCVGWLGLALGLRMELCIAQIMHPAKQVEYVELQEGHIFLTSLYP